MKVGDLVYINGSNREVTGVIISLTDLGAQVLLDNEKQRWFGYHWLEVLYESW